LKEYTLLAIAGVLIVIFIDLVILKTRLILTKKFWLFWCVMFILIFIINGYLTWRPIVLYGEEYYLGIRLFTIPIEDFLYGFALLSLNISIWEFCTKRIRK
jgi:lycopene cyclase domain-containing protein